MSPRLAPVAGALALTGCLFFGGDKLAGGGGGIEAVGIAGVATGPDGKTPVSGATVIMRRSEYLKGAVNPLPKNPATPGSARPVAGKDSAETITKRDGSFSIDSV